MTRPKHAPGAPRAATLRALAPGLTLCAGAAALALSVHALVPTLSPLVVAILAGIAVTNLAPLPAATSPGLAFTSSTVLRLGIVLLGLQLVLGDILALGLPMLGVIVGIVAIGIAGTLALGRALGIPTGQRILIACGFSICGAAAVAGVRGVTEAEDEEVVTAIALVVIFGTIAIPAIPFVGHLLGMPPEAIGMWAGGSIHEIAQVVAAGTVVGGGALAVAVVVKLARILMLAPVVAVLSIRQRRRHAVAAATAASAGAFAGPTSGASSPLVPLFVVGFLAAVLARSILPIPDAALKAGQFGQLALLSAAMFALGCGVRVQVLRRVGARPLLLATASTLLVTGTALVGILLVQGGR